MARLKTLVRACIGLALLLPACHLKAASRQQCLAACQVRFNNEIVNCAHSHPRGSAAQNQCAFIAILNRTQCINGCR